jgi:Icc-related predicted phosphoesterase
MKIRHISDTHGMFPQSIEQFDITVHSGDMCPNSPRFHPCRKKAEVEFQSDWVHGRSQSIADTLNGKPLVYILGNHDFLEEHILGYELGPQGVSSFDCNNKYQEVQGKVFYGFPWIPHCGGNWNYELDDSQMLEKVGELVELLNHRRADVLVCHAPAYGILDNSFGRRLGNNRMRQALEYRIMEENLPDLILCGHIHEDPDILTREFGKKSIKFSNSALTQNIIEL